uniref:DUF1304 domain-containing protein n=1 Tax=Demequina sp. TaxID=2050685 RepID=UPI0025E0994F
MTLAAAILAIIAGAAHVGVWAAESLFWEREPVWRLFGARSAQEAATQAGPMFNIGFYNLFLGLGAIAGGVLAVASSQWTLLVYTCLFMAGAGGVLLIRYPGLWRGALGQSAIPILAL